MRFTIWNSGVCKSLGSKTFYQEVQPYLHQLHSLAMVSKPDQNDLKVTTSFPKKCSNCSRLYPTLESFLEETFRIKPHSRDVYYKVGHIQRILRYRNCPPPCHSTLTHISSDRRDISPEGYLRRQIFALLEQEISQVLRIDMNWARDLALYLYRAIDFDGLSPIEAYSVLRCDLMAQRFTGFERDQPLEVEDVVSI